MMKRGIGIGIAAILLAAGTAHAADTSHIHEAEAFVKAAVPDCDMNDRDDIPVNLADDSDISHHVYDLKYRNSYDDPDTPDSTTELYQMFCTMGAYNEQSVFLLRSADDDAFQLLAFPVPSVTYDYAGEGDTRLAAPPVVTGYAAQLTLTNAVYDPKTGSITNHSLWRGLGDAWEGGTWAFADGAFVLNRYEVDPTYNDNADKPTGGENDSYVVFGK